MLKKLEKLKEVNETLKNVLIELETRMFIENIVEVKDKPIRDEISTSKVVVIQKQ